MNLYRNPETLLYDVVSEEGPGAVSVTDVVKTLSDLGGRALRDLLLTTIMERCDVGKRTVIDAVARTETLKKISSRTLEGRGKPKEYYLKA
ncbi:MAG: hypothetical protein GTN76_08445 [Candidatus Aenigmarchaeota archaeon]|nr:hypothetical protein [Candidatus Aenigmarchaeota archaeon]